MNFSSFSEFLYSRYNERRVKNSNYSLRAFSRDLGISSGRLTNLLKERDLPSSETVEKFSEILGMDSNEKKKLISIVSSQRYMKRKGGFEKQLNEEEFRAISDWKTWCIYTLFQADEFDASLSWITSKINLSADEIKLSLEKLEKLELIRASDDFYELNCRSVTTTNDIPSDAIRNFHKEFIPLGIHALDNIAVRERDVSSLTLCIDKELVGEYKKLISEFRAKVSGLTKDSVKTEELYQLNIQFFPLNFGERDS